MTAFQKQVYGLIEYYQKKMPNGGDIIIWGNSIHNKEVIELLVEHSIVEIVEEIEIQDRQGRDIRVRLRPFV